MKVEGDENLSSAFATNIMQTFLKYCHLVVDSGWCIRIFFHDIVKVDKNTFALSLAIATKELP